MRRRFVPQAVALALLAALTAPSRSDTLATAADVPAPAARVIVVLKADAALLREQPMGYRASARTAAATVQRRADRLASRAGVPLAAGVAISERVQVMTAQGIDARTLARRLATDPDVESASVDQRRRALLMPSDPLFASGPASGLGPQVGQWYLRTPTTEWVSAVNAEGAWDRATGSPGVVVAVLDTGVWAEHLDLAGQVLPGYDMVSDVATANDGDGRDADASDPGDWITAAEDASGPFKNCGIADSSWHGTKIAGLIGAVANNGQGMAGTAFGVKILPVRVLGKCGGYDSDIQAGMRWAAGLDVPGTPRNPNPAQVINLSLGGSGACSDSTGYPRVLAELRQAGTTVVAAAGNSAGQAVELPANCAGVIAVAGLRHAGSKVGFSDLGAEISISAPAGNCINIGANEPCLYPILSSSNSGTRRPNAGGSTWTDGYDISVGTSFAAPVVAGTAALMLSARPQLLPDEVRQWMQSGARPFPTSGAGNDENGQPVPMCHAPGGSEQLQCYCSVGLCGAGMLDAAAAVAAAQSAPLARIGPQTVAPVVGESFGLSAAGSQPATGHGLAAYAWSLVGAAGGVAAFAGATDGVEVQLLASAAGTVQVQLQVRDDAGQVATQQRSIVVTAPPLPPVSGGGGAMSALWVALLGLGVAALLHERRLSGR